MLLSAHMEPRLWQSFAALMQIIHNIFKATVKNIFHAYTFIFLSILNKNTDFSVLLLKWMENVSSNETLTLTQHRCFQKFSLMLNHRTVDVTRTPAAHQLPQAE